MLLHSLNMKEVCESTVKSLPSTAEIFFKNALIIPCAIKKRYWRICHRRSWKGSSKLKSLTIHQWSSNFPNQAYIQVLFICYHWNFSNTFLCATFYKTVSLCENNCLRFRTNIYLFLLAPPPAFNFENIINKRIIFSAPSSCLCLGN